MEAHAAANEAIHFTLTIAELQPNHKIECNQPNCESTFRNMGNYEMHLQKHHNMQQFKGSNDRLFNCPVADCIYNLTRGYNGKSFKTIKYLRQHYQKVHAEKKHNCVQCGKKFATAGILSSHAERVCGKKKFKCMECGWEYDNMEALLTHGKRRGHVFRVAKAAPDPKALSTKHKMKKTKNNNNNNNNYKSQTQSEECQDMKRWCFASVQTDEVLPPKMDSIPHPQQYGLETSSPSSVQQYSADKTTKDLDDIQSMLRDIETQTELSEYQQSSMAITESPGFLYQMIAGQSAHMYTQTNDDFLSELLLADIQTQTNWSISSPTEQKQNNQYTTSSTSTNCAHDELLVSTETQTSFTQCLFECNTDVDASDLYTTQHTQTCDDLLDGLFGGQENDLIVGFQSTYTQT